MADANSTLYKVPFWLVNHLGKRVQLLREFVDDSDVFEATLNSELIMRAR